MALVASTVIAAVGVGIAGVGAYEQYSNSKAASKASAAAAQNQAQIAGLQAANVDTEKQQLALKTQQDQLQIATNKSVIQQQQSADDIRQQAASLDATRRIREQIRSGIVASGTSLNTAATNGAGEPGSTAFKQSQANIQGQVNTNITGIEQNLDLGNRLADINRNISNTYLAAQDKNSAYVDQSQQLQSKVLDTQKQIYSLGGSVSQDYASAAISQGNAATGQGLYTLGSGIVSNYSTINRLTGYFTGTNTGSATGSFLGAGAGAGP